MKTNKPSFICGHIANYFVVIYPEKEAVGIYKGVKLIVDEKPQGLANFVGKAKDLDNDHQAQEHRDERHFKDHTQTLANLRPDGAAGSLRRR